MKLKTIFTALLVPALVYGQPCPQNVSKAKPGAVVPCDAWVVSEQQMQEFARTEDKYKIEVTRGLTLEKLRLLDEQEIEFYKVRSSSLQKEVNSGESKRFWSNLGFFVLGIVLTGVAAKAAIESSK